MALAERDITVEGHRVHLWEGGEGFPILMLHGSGPGAGTIGNWRLVLEPLAARYRIAATDLIGFGASGGKSRSPISTCRSGGARPRQCSTFCPQARWA